MPDKLIPGEKKTAVYKKQKFGTPFTMKYQGNPSAFPFKSPLKHTDRLGEGANLGNQENADEHNERHAKGDTHGPVGSPNNKWVSGGTSPAKDTNPHTGLNPPHTKENHPKKKSKKEGYHRVISKDSKTGKTDTSYVKPQKITLEEFYE